ncbi:hypothetical protein EBR96_01045 [bacterium]|nr:hypothetical protein [bacterium]
MKTFRFLILVIFPIFLMTSGEFVLKHSINSVTEPAEVTVARPVTAPRPAVMFHSLPPKPASAGFVERVLDRVERAMHLVSDIRVVAGVLMVTGGGLLWLVAMSRYELSFIYPFLTINYLAIVVGAQWVLGEQLNSIRIFSAIFVVIGLLLISKSPNSERQ